MLPIICRKLFLLFLFSFCVFALNAQKNGKMGISAFIYQPFAHKSDLQTFQKNYKWFTRLSKEIIENKYIKTNDTIYHFRIWRSDASFYHTKNKNFLLKTNIKSKRLKLANGLKLGMTRDDFLKRFKNLKPNEENEIEFVSDDKMGKCIFRFKNNRLKQIIIEYFPD